MSDGSDSAIAIYPTVDWVTATALGAETKEALWSLSRGYEAQAIMLGELIRPWGAHGYRGWTCDHFSYGERTDGAIVRLGGWKADAGWSNVSQLCDHCTRVDLACTVLLPAADRTLARTGYSRMVSAPRREGRPTSARLIEGTDSSSTLYVGSRQSQNFGRLYDKGVESKSRPAGFLWRYEVELKEEAARAGIVALSGHPAWRKWLAGAVGSWFALRNVPVPWARDAAVMRHEERGESSAERSLRWLTLSVRPLVHRLIDALGEESVRAALAIPSRASAFVNPAA